MKVSDIKEMLAKYNDDDEVKFYFSSPYRDPVFMVDKAQWQEGEHLDIDDNSNPSGNRIIQLWMYTDDFLKRIPKDKR